MNSSSTYAEPVGPFLFVVPAPSEAERHRAGMLQLWVDVTNAGGAVGFVPPATGGDIAPTLDRLLARVGDGEDTLGLLLEPAHDDPPRVVGMGALVRRGIWLSEHWRTLARFMVHPDVQGGGTGLAFLECFAGLAKRRGLEQLHLTLRDGLGLENFYSRAGFELIGRHPRSLKLTDDDYRDELMMVRHLR